MFSGHQAEASKIPNNHTAQLHLLVVKVQDLCNLVLTENLKEYYPVQNKVLLTCIWKLYCLMD